MFRSGEEPKTDRGLLGFLHGAYFEGLDVGGQVAECIKGGGCAGIAHVDEVQNAKPYKI